MQLKLQGHLPNTNMSSQTFFQKRAKQSLQRGSCVILSMHSDVSKFTIVCFLISARQQLPSTNNLLIIRCVHAWERHREREREITVEWPTSSSWVDGPRYTPIAGIIMDAACCGWWWSPYFPSARKRKISIGIIIQSISSLGGKGTKSFKNSIVFISNYQRK